NDIIRWVDEWLSDRQHGGFYGSQDADLSMDDDGDYFTWTLEEARAVLTPEELQIAAAYYDIGEVGEMHHNPQKNVLFVAKGMDEIATQFGKTEDDVFAMLASTRRKMYAARLERPTPYVDKTVYVNWNALLISAYLEAARVLHNDDARRFALKSLDRILAEAWNPEAARLGHVIAYSDPKAAKRAIPGMLDDYAFTAIACLDAYESTSDLTYFNFARAITDAMIRRFYDETAGGFFDMDTSADPTGLLGALTARRKPLQDSPTPAGNSAAIIALMRVYGYTQYAAYKDKAEDTLEAFAGVVDHFGIFAATFGIGLRLYLTPEIQVVVVGEDTLANELYAAAVAPFALNKAVLHLREGQAVAQNLPPALAETIPNLPALKLGKSVAIICSGFACQPPISDPAQLTSVLKQAITAVK
ncbi:MAG: hypothetical protein JWN45_472, partial [Acidobacteriaceae bacterium]|nr:hypothetical protein [Acidobacteriaceae bacterium]